MIQRGRKNSCPQRGQDAAATNHEELLSAWMGSGCHANPPVVTQLRSRLRMTLLLEGSVLVFIDSLDTVPRHFCSYTLVTCLMPTFKARTAGAPAWCGTV